MMDFFDGYLCYYKEQTTKELELIPGFQAFVEMYYKTQKNPSFHHHWAKLISFFSTSDENAFDEFYKLYDIFHRIKKKPFKNTFKIFKNFTHIREV